MPVETLEPPAKTSAPASLKALFDLPSDLVETPDPPVTEPETPPVKPPDKPEAPPAAEPESKKPDAITSRLAPDFSKVETEPVVAAAPDTELAELDQAIEAAPTEKAKIDLKKFRDQYATFKDENRILKARPAVQPEDTKTLVTSLQEENRQLLEKVERANLFDSPKFQREFIQPRVKAFQAAQGIVKESGGDTALLERAMALNPGKARTELFDEIREAIPSEMMKGRFDRQIEAIDAKTAEINEKLANSRRELEESHREETVQTLEKRQKQDQQLEGLLGSAILDLQENVKLGCLIKTGKPEFKWHDDNVDKIAVLAKDIYLNSTPEKSAYASVAAAAFDTVHAWWEAERAANKAKDQEIAELKGADPGITADRTASKIATDGIEPDDILSRLRGGAYRKP